MLNQTLIKIKEKQIEEEDKFYIGVQGDPGPQGSKGAIGDTGETGYRGAQGERGAGGIIGKDATGILEVEYEGEESGLYYYYAVESIETDREEELTPKFYAPLDFNTIKEIEKPIVRVYICNDVYTLYQEGEEENREGRLAKKIITLPDGSVINLAYKQIVEIVYIKAEDKWLHTIISI